MTKFGSNAINSSATEINLEIFNLNFPCYWICKLCSWKDNSSYRSNAWVRCASGNVFSQSLVCLRLQTLPWLWRKKDIRTHLPVSVGWAYLHTGWAAQHHHHPAHHCPHQCAHHHNFHYHHLRHCHDHWGETKYILKSLVIHQKKEVRGRGFAMLQRVKYSWRWKKVTPLNSMFNLHHLQTGLICAPDPLLWGSLPQTHPAVN